MLYLNVPWAHLFVDYSIKEKVMKLSSTFVSNNSKRNILTLISTALALSFSMIGLINLTDLDLDPNCKCYILNIGPRL